MADSIVKGEGSLAYVHSDDVFADVFQIIEKAQLVAQKAVDVTHVRRNWLLGRRIVEEELAGGDRARYGANVVPKLAEDLTLRYGRGYTKRSLWKYARFYRMFSEIVPTASAQSGRLLFWSHYEELMRVEDGQILVLDIEPSPGHVVSRMSDKEMFLRQNDKSVKLNREQVLALEYDKNQRSYENEVQDRSSMEDVDHDVLTRYKADIGVEGLPDEQVLRSRGFLVGGHLTNAGVLLFSEYPGKFMPWAWVRVLRVDGTKMSTGSRMNVVKDRTFDGPLPKVIDGAKDFISGQLCELQFLGKDGRFEVIPEYPEFAWFEGLMNAVTYRNYAFSGDYIRVTMYDDRMEILSP